MGRKKITNCKKIVKVNKKLAIDRKTFISKKDLFGGTFTIKIFAPAIGQNILKPMQENSCPKMPQMSKNTGIERGNNI